jgi:anti-sigma B factor antagonist
MMVQETLAVTSQAVPSSTAPPRVIPFSGRLTFGADSEKRYAELRRHVERGERNFIFDLGQVPDVDSAGIGFLVTCFSTVIRAGGELRLAAPGNHVLYVLLITRLDTVFPIFESVEEATRG